MASDAVAVAAAREQDAKEIGPMVALGGVLGVLGAGAQVEVFTRLPPCGSSFPSTGKPTEKIQTSIAPLAGSEAQKEPGVS